jgi:hypothetical protein
VAEQTDELLEQDDPPVGWRVLAPYVVLLVAGFGVAVWCTVAWYGGCDDGRHVSPFTAGDSLRGELCDAGGGVLTGLLLPAAWVVGLTLATVAVVRGARTLVLVLLLLAPALLPGVAYAGLMRSSTTCSGDELAAYRAWADQGSRGAAPSDCRTF